MIGTGHLLFEAEEILATQHILLGVEKTVVMAKIPDPGTSTVCRCEAVKFRDRGLGH